MHFIFRESFSIFAVSNQNLLCYEKDSVMLVALGDVCLRGRK